jgi:hypothetical protein
MNEEKKQEFLTGFSKRREQENLFGIQRIEFNE